MSNTKKYIKELQWHWKNKKLPLRANFEDEKLSGRNIYFHGEIT